MKRVIHGVLAALVSTAAVAASPSPAPSTAQVTGHYADLAHAMYSDALSTARTLQGAVDQLIAQPSEDTLRAAREAWVAARHPYQQTEAYRFGNPIVDDWEGKVNAWPLDEGLIDYVDPSYGEESDENPYYTVNVIAHETLQLSGRTIDATTIDKALLADTLHEVDEIEANVATGYHAIEFLLWGQDLNGTDAGAGQRPATDYDTAQCTGGHCERRAQYLKAVTALLIEDLAWMADQWAEGGAARQAVVEAGDAGLGAMFTGMGSLSYGELAGERMKLGLMLHDPEEEHDCFSDNTHYSHFDDAMSIRNVYTGTYTRVDGTRMSGPSLSALVAARDAAVDATLRESLDATVARMQVLVDRAKAGEAYDQMIGEGNAEGNARVQAAIDALLVQTRAIEDAVTTLGLERIAFEGSDSLDAPDKVGQ